jgi:hypothetical protein
MDQDKYPIGEIIDIACKAGKIVLENGGETYRVEETMLYFCRAFGIHKCESYSTPTTIIISIIDNNGESFTRMMRILSRGININKVEAVNNLSREINEKPMTIAEAKKKLQEINDKQPYSLWIDALAKEEQDSSAADQYKNIVAVKSGQENSEKTRALIEALKSDEVRDFIVEQYKGAVVAMD